MSTVGILNKGVCRFQIDTIAKEIHVLEDCQLGELISAVEVFLPEWREYKLVSKTPHEFSNPIIITIKERSPYVYPPLVPSNPRIIMHMDGTTARQDTDGYANCTTDYTMTIDSIGVLHKGVYNFQSE